MPLPRPRPVRPSLVLLVMMLAGCQTPLPPADPFPSAPAALQSGLGATRGARSELPAPVAGAALPAADAPGATGPGGSGYAALDPAVQAAPPPRTDLWGRMQRGFKLDALDDALVEAHARRFAASGFFARRAEAVRLFLPSIVTAVEARGLPMELALLPMVESSLNPNARSPVGATGTWQFMAPTARRFALRQSHLVDDRKDFERATAAALDYLQQLHELTGDWHLAMASYNWGEGRVLRHAERLRGRGERADFVHMSAYMPAETRNYVPQIAALCRIVAEPERYGVELPDVPDEAGLEAVALAHDVDLALLLRYSGLAQARFTYLNPGVRPPLVLAAATPQIWLPPGPAAQLRLQLAQHRGPHASWSVRRVTATEPLERIAARLGVAPSALRDANRIPRGMKPTAGSVLIVPLAQGKGEQTDGAVVAHASFALTPDVVKSTLQVRRGESMSAAARRAGVDPAALGRWNGMTPRTRLRAGQSLVVWVERGRERTLLAESRAGASTAHAAGTAMRPAASRPAPRAAKAETQRAPSLAGKRLAAR